jgi:hypothetical protein
MTRTMTRGKEIVARTVLVLVALAAGLACVELGLRWIGYKHPSMQTIGDKILPVAGFPTTKMYTYDTVTGFSMVPNIHDDARGITTDARGFRVTSRPFDPSRPTIAFVGDSTVFGYLSRDEDSYPYVMSTMPDFDGYNLVNLGVPAYSLAHIKHVMAVKVPPLKPTLVVVEILWPWKPFESYTSKPDAWKELDMTLYGNSFTRRASYEPAGDAPRFATSILLEDAWRKLAFGRQIRENFSRPTQIRDFTVSEPVETQLAFDHVTAFREAAKPVEAEGAKVLYYIHPFQYTLFRDEYKGLGVIGRRIFNDELGAVYMGDCIVAHHARRPSEPLFVDDEHMTKPGNVVLAGCVRDAVKSRLAH